MKLPTVCRYLACCCCVVTPIRVITSSSLGQSSLYAGCSPSFYHGNTMGVISTQLVVLMAMDLVNNPFLPSKG